MSKVQSLKARTCTTTRTAKIGQARVINASVGFLAFLAVDAVCGGSRELWITFFSF